MRLRPHLVAAERLLDSVRLRAYRTRPPAHFRIESYGGHGGPHGVVVRGRVLDDPPATEAEEGEGVGAAVRRTLAGFVTHELPGVPLLVAVGDATVEVESDGEGYFTARLQPDEASLVAPVTVGRVSLARPWRGLTGEHATPVDVHVTSPAGRFGVLSDVDDTILETGVQRLGLMLRQTFTGSALTRTPFAGAPELYRDLAAGVNPCFYVSSSPWNLHGFLAAFLRHRAFPLGPLLLRDLLGTAAGREQKHGRIREVLALHPHLPFVLLGDSGEHDPQVYADVVREHPGRVLAVYIREVRLDPGDGRVEAVTEGWDAWAASVPFVLAADSDAVRRHAASLGLL
ncbi:phosphatase domain-containing protein [Nocardioides perillae]|uniref:Phosphatidate phosphatase APP1 n=1 Tax=Nocardioides perillae TaxID=1119534 RepID=A0A7Y9RP19_9ACTN|nr:phosphatidate phosphatase APP1 [Nocardioides perillae]